MINVKRIALKQRKKRERQKYRGKQSKNKRKPHMYLSIITLNVNGFNAPAKRHRVAEWKRKQDPYNAASKRLLSDQKIHRD